MAVIGSYVTVLFVIIASGVVSQETRERIANTAGLAPALLTACAAGYVSRQKALNEKVRRAWMFIGLAYVCLWLGDCAWFVIESVLHEKPEASVADVGYLLYPLLLMTGLLSFPHVARSVTDRLKMRLDIAIVVCACCVTVWHFAVGPDLLAKRSNLAVFVVTVGQPIGDIAALLGVTVLWLRRNNFGKNRTLGALSAAVLTQAITDCVFAILVRNETYVSGGYAEVGWVLNALFVSLAAYWQLRDDASSESDPQSNKRPLIALALPYSAIAIAYAMLLQSAFATNELALKVVVSCATLITLLVIARQVVAVRENIRLQAAEEALRGERRLQALVRNSLDVVTIVDADTTIRYVSQSLEPLTGLSSTGVIGLKVLDGVHRDDRTAAILFFAVLAKEGAAGVRGEWRMRHGNGQWRLTDNVGTNLNTDPAVAGLVVNTRDITESRALEEQLRHQAFHDSLTGIPNRQLFTDRVNHAFRRSVRDRAAIAVLFIDLDNFKSINDTQGHSVGDDVLKVMANRLAVCARDGDTLARFGGDEFAVLLEDLKSLEDAEAAAERIIEELRLPFDVGGLSVTISASIGVSGGADATSPSELMRNADVAMYVAKSDGRGRKVRFQADMHAKVLERLELEADMRRALDENQFVLNYQPIVGLTAGELVSVEALIRWDHPVRGRLQPGSFIGVAEETGLIVQIGRWVLREATHQAAQWHREGPRGLRVGVNISTRHLCEPTFLDDVRNALESSGLESKYLLIEITESVLMSNTASIILVLDELKAMGVSLALDDFGTGYSSLAYLQQLPIDVLKIDKSFMDKLSDGSADPILVKAIVNLGATLRLRVVAEGIETLDQVAQLQVLGCDLGQGFYFDKAVTAAKIQEYLNGDTALASVNAEPADIFSAA